MARRVKRAPANPLRLANYDASSHQKAEAMSALARAAKAKQATNSTVPADENALLSTEGQPQAAPRGKRANKKASKKALPSTNVNITPAATDVTPVLPPASEYAPTLVVPVEEAPPVTTDQQLLTTKAEEATEDTIVPAAIADVKAPALEAILPMLQTEEEPALPVTEELIAAPEEEPALTAAMDEAPAHVPAPAAAAAPTRGSRSLLATIVGAVLRLAAPAVAVATVAFKRLRALFA